MTTREECEGCHRHREDAREVTVRKGTREMDIVVCDECEDDLNGEIVDEPEVPA